MELRVAEFEMTTGGESRIKFNQAEQVAAADPPRDTRFLLAQRRLLREPAADLGRPPRGCPNSRCSGLVSLIPSRAGFWLGVAIVPGGLPPVQCRWPVGTDKGRVGWG